MRLDSLYSHSKKNQPICIWRFSRGTFIRWLIRVIALGLQLAPLLNQGSQSSFYSQKCTELLWPKAKAFASLSHSNAPNAEQLSLLKNAALESLAIQQLKTEETILKGSNWWNSALNSTGWLFIAKWNRRQTFKREKWRPTNKPASKQNFSY